MISVKSVSLRFACLLATLFCSVAFTGAAADAADRGDKILADYFRSETAKLSGRCLTDINTLEDWTSRRAKYREELLEMLGLWPLPERSDLKPVVTGKVEADSFVVEKLYFQSLPGLYVTANLYLPKNLTKPAPAILYVCGHGPVIKDGISYGNKVSYQHHGAWFAQNGYVCLIIDTLQLGEIQGIDHGTYREGMWWWNSRGYTPAGVEAWDGVRALDYLCTRPEVDTNRFGITGRSGGGAYSWTISAIDDRIKVAAPVAGITDLQNHVVDGTVEGHCDCMFFVNTYRWDYPQLAAMVAPRPLLIGNSDRDTIFPLNGVERVHWKVRHLYDLYGASTNLTLLITDGPHKDTQVLQLPVLRWFNRFLKGEDPLIETAAKTYFEPEQLKVFDKLPDDQRNTTIQETFVPMAKPIEVPRTVEAWNPERNRWLAALKEKCFAGWPQEVEPLEVKQIVSAKQQGVRLDGYEFTSQPPFRLRLYLVRRSSDRKPQRVRLVVQDEGGWQKWMAGIRYAFGDALKSQDELEGPGVDSKHFEEIRQEITTNNEVMVCFAPRGIGPNRWSGDAKKQIQIRRRFMLLGQTLDSMRVWDIRRAIQALQTFRSLRNAPLRIEASHDLAVDALYASLFEKGIAGLDLHQMPASHREGPDYLNVLRVLDMPQTVAMAAERSQVRLFETDSNGWEYPLSVSQRLGWNEKQFVLEPTKLQSSRHKTQ